MSISRARQENGKVMESSAWRDESWGNCERWPVTVLTWRAAEDCSKYKGRRPEKLSHRRLTAAYGGQSVTSQNEWRHQRLENGSRNRPADGLQLMQNGEAGRDGLRNVWRCDLMETSESMYIPRSRTTKAGITSSVPTRLYTSLSVYYTASPRIVILDKVVC